MMDVWNTFISAFLGQNFKAAFQIWRVTWVKDTIKKVGQRERLGTFVFITGTWTQQLGVASIVLPGART
jgi:hypothetical protein